MSQEVEYRVWREGAEEEARRIRATSPQKAITDFCDVTFGFENSFEEEVVALGPDGVERHYIAEISSCHISGTTNFDITEVKP